MSTKMFGGWNVYKGWGKGAPPARREQQGCEGDHNKNYFCKSESEIVWLKSESEKVFLKKMVTRW